MTQQEHQLQFSRFFAAGGDPTHMYNFPLNSESVVFDIGSFDGVYFRELYNRYNCIIHAFEPVREFFDQTNVNLPDKIILNNMALGANGDTFNITLSGNASSEFIEGNSVECTKAEFTHYTDVLNIDHIDLLKVNCEGGEYELLETISEVGFLPKINYIMVQFHLLGNDPINRRNAIVNSIEKTHEQVFSYPFVWECWKLK